MSIKQSSHQNCAFEFASYILKQTMMHLPLQETPRSSRSEKRKVKTPLLITPSYSPELLHLAKGYVMTPSAQKIFYNNFIAENLTIKTKYTTVKWQGITDLSKLMQPLSETLILKNCFIEVYINDQGKPEVGQQLNKRCIASFVSKKRLQLSYLQRICLNYRTDLISVDLKENFFEVQIPHFTIYNYNSKSDDEVASSDDDTEEQLKEQHFKHNTDKTQNYENPLNNRTVAIPKSNLKQQNQKRGSFQNAKTLQRNLSLRKNLNTERPFPVPSGSQINATDKHNKTVQKYHGLFSQQIYFSGNDKACNLLRRKNQCQIAQLQRKQYQPCRAISMFLMSVTGDQGVDQLIDKQIQVSFKMRRVAALMQILFFSEQSKVNFQKIYSQNQVIKKLFVSSKPQKSNLHEQRLKNWLEWMLLNSDNGIPKPEDRIYKKLVMRRPCKLAQQFREMKKIDNAEFLCSIQDPIYRHDKSQVNLIGELQCIASEITQKIPKMHWLAEMGIHVWYFILTQLRQRIKLTISKYLDCIDSHFQEFRLFALYLGQESDKKSFFNLPSDPNQQNLDDLFCSWMISYKLRDLEKRHYKPIKYEKYRYNLLKNILFKLQRAKHIIDFLNAENYLPKAPKNYLLREVLLKKPQLCNDLKYLQWEEKQDLINEVLAIKKMNKFDYRSSLQHFANIRSQKRVQKNKEAIIQLANNPEIVLHYRQDVVQKHYNLIETFKLPQLKTLKVALQLRLGITVINKNTLTALFEYIKQIAAENAHTLMNLLFPSFKKCRRMVEIWQQEPLIYKQMHNLYSSNTKAMQYMKTLILNNKLIRQITIQ